MGREFIPGELGTVLGTEAQEPDYSILIVIASKNADLLELHLRSHSLFTPPGLVRFSVVDSSNSGATGVRDAFFKSMAMMGRPERLDAYVDRRGSGLYYGGLVNAGVSVANPKGSVLVLANDDTVVGPNWLPGMLADFRDAGRADRPTGVLGARSNSVGGPQNLTHRALAIHGVVPNRAFPWPRIVTFFAMVSTEGFLRIGGFDAALPAHNFSDDILSHRFLVAGYCNWVSGVFVHHLGSQTFQRSQNAPEVYRRDMEAGRSYLEGKYPMAERVAKGEIQRWFPDL